MPVRYQITFIALASKFLGSRNQGSKLQKGEKALTHWLEKDEALLFAKEQLQLGIPQVETIGGIPQRKF